MREYTRLIVLVLVCFAVSGCGLLDSVAPPPVPRPISGPTRVSTPTITPTIVPNSVSTIVSTEVSGASPTELVVAVANRRTDIPSYNRREWRHWRDEDGDCQDARQEVLIAESMTPVTFKTDERCRVATGRWTGPYTGTVVEDPGKLDIDHMVPLANAHRSGGWAWDRDRKAAFANDLEFDGHLVATTAAANRGKGSKGPEDWRPPDRSYWCEYAKDWATIKNQWGLTVTQEEFDALLEIAATCEGNVAIKSLP